MFYYAWAEIGMNQVNSFNLQRLDCILILLWLSVEKAADVAGSTWPKGGFPLEKVLARRCCAVR
jgi:hypothetical protein